MRYLIQTELEVELSTPVREHHLQLRLAPWADEWQTLDDCRLDVEPFAEPIGHRDGFGNPILCLALMAAHKSLSVNFHAEVQTLLHDPFDYQPVAPWRELDWIHHSLRQAPRLWDFVLHPSPWTLEFPWLVPGDKPPKLAPDMSLMEQVQLAMEWVASVTDRESEGSGDAAQPSAKSQDHYGGSTDRTQLLIAVVRSWGVPARFATGYLDPAYFESDENAQDFRPHPQSMRAWADVLIPGAGWRGFDPLVGLVVNDTYVRVAVGRDAGDVVVERATFKGEGADQRVRLQLDVSPA